MLLWWFCSQKNKNVIRCVPLTWQKNSQNVTLFLFQLEDLHSHNMPCLDCVHIYLVYIFVTFYIVSNINYILLIIQLWFYLSAEHTVSCLYSKLLNLVLYQGSRQSISLLAAPCMTMHVTNKLWFDLSTVICRLKTVLWQMSVEVRFYFWLVTRVKGNCGWLHITFATCNHQCKK